MYEAIIAPIISIKPHPKSTNGLLLIEVAGSQVISTCDLKVGQLVAFFPEGGQLSAEFLTENSEYRVSTSTGLPVGPNKDPSKSGLFEASGRIRTIKLLGEPSEGYITPLSHLLYTGFNPGAVKPFEQFTVLNGHEVVRKYETPQTIRSKGAPNLQKAKKKISVMFHEHYDTPNARFILDRIPEGAILSFSEKAHGTSGRSGNVQKPKEKLSWAGLFLVRLAKRFLGISLEQAIEWEVLSGTRRVVLQNGTEGENSYHKGNFRSKIHETLKPHIKKGETLYYEIVGYDNPCHPMFSHTIPDDAVGREIKKRYNLKGNTFEYSYGCNRELGEFKVLLYRVTVTNEVGTSWDLSMDEVEARASQLQQIDPNLDIHSVPQLGSGIIFYKWEGEIHTVMIRTPAGDYTLKDYCNLLSEGMSTMGDHIREGVCIRITHPTMVQKVVKYKGFSFSHFEGIRKNDPDYLDIEEAQDANS